MPASKLACWTGFLGFNFMTGENRAMFIHVLPLSNILHFFFASKLFEVFYLY